MSTVAVTVPEEHSRSACHLAPFFLGFGLDFPPALFSSAAAAAVKLELVCSVVLPVGLRRLYGALDAGPLTGWRDWEPASEVTAFSAAAVAVRSVRAAPASGGAVVATTTSVSSTSTAATDSSSSEGSELVVELGEALS